MQRDPREAIVIGAGIGGLSAALSLHRAGIGVTLYESVREIRPLGVGINLLPHSVRILTDLGLAEHLDRIAIRTAELAYYNKYGQRIWSEPRGLEAGYRWPQYSVHRGLLQTTLVDAVKERIGADAIRTGHTLQRVATEGGKAIATLARHRADGGRESEHSVGADLVVAADGIHSACRRQWYPAEGPPKFAGQLLWRATTNAPAFLTGRSMIMAGHQGQKFVCYPIGRNADGTAIVNWIAERRIGGDEPPRPSDWNREIDRATFAPLFASWKFDWLDIPALIAGAAKVYEFPMVDRDPLPRWTFGRATLLGDAAHPMYPIGSNGASQAILDADALRVALDAEPDVEAALARYEEARRPPTAKIVESNRQMGPERVMQIVEERAPAGFRNLHDVISREELESIAAAYKQVAGFDREALNRQSA
jgi:2-polyprenyl-6-methoxyphenol hydroxylase-like FAD-dependent oxidoreductase